MTVHNYKFESMADLIAAKELPYAFPDNAKNSYQTRDLQSYEGRWVCADRDIHSHTDVKNLLAEQTFPQGVARVEKLASELTIPTPINRRRKPYRSDAGDDLDMSRVWQGDLEHAWTAMHRAQTVGPSRVLVVVDVSAPGMVEPKTMAFRGAAALAYAAASQDAGYTVAINAACHLTLNDADGSPYTAEVTLLPPGHELDIHKLSNLIASALLFRGVIMDHMVRVGTTRVDEGIGRCQDLDLKKLDAAGYDHVAVIDRRNVKDQQSAQAWLAQNIAALNGVEE